MFRVAEFKIRNHRQEFIGFKIKGYNIKANGQLHHPKKKISNDKRCKNYVELNLATGFCDVNSKPIYQKDIVYDYNEHANGWIDWLPDVGGFAVIARQGKIEIPYAVLDGLSKLELRGNIYQNQVLNRWK